MAATLPTEDTIKALLEYLVFPLLPIRELEDENPTELQHQMVAKQMHAVVMLYNYYHRKHFQELEVLGFEAFCKICCVANPGLLMYMRHMHNGEDYSEDLYNHLSITEKTVINACKVCMALDSSKDIPNMKHWPISKVAVFLVDPLRERCVLQFSSITEGVWSLVEKGVEAHHEKTEIKLEQLAFSAVEQETGIIRADLSILDCHLTYSLSHEKTTTQLYIMSYGRAKCEELTEVTIKDVMKCSEGPIVRSCLPSEIVVTSVVEYYNLLPYIDIISNWLSRDNRDSSNLMRPTIEDHVVNEKSVSSVQKTGMCKIKASKSESDTVEFNRNDVSLVNGSSKGASTPRLNPDVLPMKHKTVPKVPNNEILNKKKKISKDTISLNKRIGGHSRTTNSCKMLETKCHLVQDGMPSVGDNGNKKLSGLNDQRLNIKSNKMIKTEIRTIEKDVDDVLSNSGSSCEGNRLQDVDDISGAEPDSIITVKDNRKGDKSSQTGQSKGTVIFKKNNITVLEGAVSSSNFAGHQLINDICPGIDGIPTIGNHVVNKEYVSSAQMGDMYNCKLSKGESGTVETNRNDLSSVNGLSRSTNLSENRGASTPCRQPDRLAIIDNSLQKGPDDDILNSVKNKLKDVSDLSSINGSCCEHTRMQDVADLPKVEEDSLDIVKDDANGDKFCQGGQSKETVISKNNIKNAVPGYKEVGDTCTSGSFLKHLRYLPSEDISRGNIIADTCSDRRKISVDDGSIAYVDGSNFKAGADNSTKKACMTKFTVGKRTNASDSNQAGFCSGDPPVVPAQFSSNVNNTFYHFIASKKNDLLQASLRIFCKKRDELHEQLRLLEDDAACCEMNIQTIQSEGEENSASKVELIIEAVNSLTSSQVQMGTNQSSEGSSSQVIKRRKISEALLTSSNSCQELDDICCRNSWMLPRYRVVPSFSNTQSTGKFQATVTVEGMEFECSSEGDLKSSPHEARNAAAAHMLTKLRRMASLEQ